MAVAWPDVLLCVAAGDSLMRDSGLLRLVAVWSFTGGFVRLRR